MQERQGRHTRRIVVIVVSAVHSDVREIGRQAVVFFVVGRRIREAERQARLSKGGVRKIIVRHERRTRIVDVFFAGGGSSEEERHCGGRERN